MGQRSRLDRLLSLSSVVPLGVFVMLQVWTATALLSSHAAYDRQQTWLSTGIVGVLVLVFEVVFLLVPLLVHAGLGLLRRNEPDHAYESDLMRSLARVSAVVVLAFVGWHFWNVQLPALTGRVAPGGYSTRLVALLSATSAGIPWTALAYLAGSAVTMFHLVNTGGSVLLTLDVTGSFAGRARLRALVKALAILFFALSSAIVLELATGTRFFPADVDRAARPCGTSASPAREPRNANTPPALSGARP